MGHYCVLAVTADHKITIFSELKLVDWVYTWSELYISLISKRYFLRTAGTGSFEEWQIP